MSEAVHPLIGSHRVSVVPGVYDVLSAKIAQRVGFHAVVLTGCGFAASHLGEPDFGLFTQSEVLDCARHITAAVDIGVIVDGDTGHGGPLSVQPMVRKLEVRASTASASYSQDCTPRPTRWNRRTAPSAATVARRRWPNACTIFRHSATLSAWTSATKTTLDSRRRLATL